MTADVLERLASAGRADHRGRLCARPRRTPSVLAALMPDRRVVVATSASGAAEGAALLAHWGGALPSPKTQLATAWSVPGLNEYRERWSALVGA